MLGIGLFALAVQAVASSPAPANPEPVEEVVVTGRLDAIERFVEGLTAAPPRDRLARWDVGVCPRALGMAARQAGYLVNRVRSLALANSVPVGDERCESNLFIVVADDAQALAGMIARRHPRLLAPSVHGRATRAEVAQWLAPRPVRALHVTRRVSAAFTMVEVNGKKRRLSKNTPAERRDISIVILIVDAKSLPEVTWGQLSAYVSMLAFTRADPDAQRPAESILALFDEQARSRPGATALSAWDRAFLAGLYGTNPISRVTKQRNAIGERMRRELAADPAGGTPVEPAPDQRE